MKKILKKAVSVAAAVIMVASIVMVQTPSVSSAGDVNPWGAPSVECWTDSLTDDEGNSIFNLKSSADGGNWKELQFGAYDPSGEGKKPVNWYIANADKDSVDLLAYALQGSGGEENFLKPFGSSVFNENVFNHKLDSNLGGTNLEYVESGVSVTDVYANHYGASKIRSRLNNEADGLIVTAFTAGERDMMNPTPITIVDYKNTKDGERMHYTVSDKLYLANADNPGDKIIKLGSGGRVEVPLGAGNGHPYGIDNPVDRLYADFWIAGAEPDSPYALIADTKNHLITESGYVTTDLGFFPACNLNLESALFFSAAPVEVSGTSAVGELSGSQPFIIRHDGTEVAALADASVKYDNVRIQAKAGSAGPATLVVQWHDGSKDYYFEKCLATGESAEVTFSGLVVVSGCTVGTLSEDCKVWLEYTDTTSNLTYAKPGDYIIHNITYVLNDGGDTTTSNPNPASYEEGDEIELADATRTGYVFDGWYEDENLHTRIEKIESTRTGDLTLYAKWTPITYTVAFDVNGGSGTMNPQTMTYGQPQNLGKCTFTPKSNCTFAGWNTKADGTGTSYGDEEEVSNFSATDDTVTLYAIWNPIQYAITYHMNKGGVAVPDDAPVSYTYYIPDTIWLPRLDGITGYAFDGWYEDEAFTTAKSSIKPGESGNLDLYAKWSGIHYTVKFHANDGASEEAVHSQLMRYGKDTPLAPNTFKRVGYAFAGWNTKADGTGESYADRAMVSNLTDSEDVPFDLYAKWTESPGNTHMVTWKMDDGSVIDTTQVEDGGCPAHADAIKEGYVFTGWTPAFSAVTADTTYKATFYGPVHTPVLVDGSAAACTGNGYKAYYKCGDCDKLFSDPACTAEISNLDTWKNGDGKIAATGHNVISIPEVPATEEKDGLHAYYYCGRCEKYFDDAECTNEITDLESWKQGAGRIPSGSGHTHDFNATSYIWHDGCGECTAYHACTAATCGFTEMETVSSTKSGDTYTAAFTKEGFEEQTKTVTPEHIHTFSEDWSKNESVHWHAATCDHHDLSKGIEAHQYDGDNICNICGYEKASQAPDPTVTPTPTVTPDSTVTPLTGAARNTAPFVLLLVAAGVVVVTLLARRRRSGK